MPNSKPSPAEQKNQLTQQIIIALVAGILLGWLYSSLSPLLGGLTTLLEKFLFDGLFLIVGKAFVNLLKVLVVPLVFIGLVCGICASDESMSVGRVGSKAFALYLMTTSLAIIIALLLAAVINPGGEASLALDSTFQPATPPSLVQVIINMFPTNIIQAMAEASMLQVIVFSILLGIGIKATGARAEKLKEFFESANEVVMEMVFLVMKLAPIGVFSLVVTVFAENGIAILQPLMAYILTVIAALLIHSSGTISLMLFLLARMNPLAFIKKAYPALLFGFSTASSAATIPITLRVMEQAIGVKESIAAFTVPMGATINMDGTAIMQGVATVFIAGAYGIDLTTTQYLMVILTATLASVGTAAVPGAGMITLSMVLLQVGLPVEAIGLILGVDRILDMLRTSVNIYGDMTVTAIVDASESGR